MAVSFALALLSVFKIIPVDIVFILLASALSGIVYGFFKRKKQAKNTAAEPSSSKHQISAPGEKEADK